MRKITGLTIFLLIFLTACASPVPQPTATPMPPPTLTASPSPTSTETPEPTSTPTATATAEPVVEAIKIANMSEFPRGSILEKGVAVEMADLYGAGAATITVEAVKLPEEGQVLEYQEMMTMTQPSSEVNGYRSDGMSLKFVTLERASLLKIDIVDNSKVSDGYWTVLQLGTLRNGRQVSFDLWVKGNIFTKEFADNIFNSLKVGKIIDQINLFYYPNESITLVDIDRTFFHENFTETDMAMARLAMLGKGTRPVSRNDIMDTISNGGVLDPSLVAAGSIK